MRRVRIGLLVFSSALVALIVGGGLALRAGAAETAYRHVLDFSEVFGLVIENYVDEVDEASVLPGAYQGLMNGLDSRGAYLTPAEVEAWKKGPTGTADPGLSVLKAGSTLQVVAVAEGSAGAEANVVPGDQIRRIDGRSARTLSLDQAVRCLRGPEGTPVALTLIRSRENFKKVELTLRRSARRAPPYSLTVGGSTAVLRLLDLSRWPQSDLAEALRGLPERGVERLLVDLRDLAEGTPREATRVAALFVTGQALRLKDREGKAVEAVPSFGGTVAWGGRLGVLVNGATAGGAEALALMLHAGRSALVLGEPTFGLGTEPRLLELPDGAGLLLSTWIWETVSGTRWDRDGVAPDRVVRGEGKPEEIDHDQLRKAIREFEKEAAAPEAAKAAA